MSCERLFRRVRGYTYLWTLALVALLGAGLSAAVELHTTALRRDQERQLLFVGHQFRDAIGSYHQQRGVGSPQYPLTMEDLLKDPRFANPTRHLRRVYLDPVTGKAEWGLIRLQGRIVGVRPLSQKQPIKQDNFDDVDAGLRRKVRYADWIFTYPADLQVKEKLGPPPTP